MATQEELERLADEIYERAVVFRSLVEKGLLTLAPKEKNDERTDRA